jgi:hypothetical protein
MGRIGGELVGRLASRVGEAVERCIMFVGREETHIGASTVECVEDIEGGSLEGDAIVDGAPTPGVWAVDEEGRVERWRWWW